MQTFLDKLQSYADICERIVQGHKIHPDNCNPTIIDNLEKLAARMYTGFFTPLEPQSIFVQKGWGQEEIAYMGNSSLHPLSRKNLDEARALHTDKTDYTVYGMDMSLRHTVSESNDSRPHVLVKGDFVALSQALNHMASRLSHANPSSLPPIIIQDKEFFGAVFADDDFDFTSIGIRFSQNADETSRILNEYSKAYPAQDVLKKAFSPMKAPVNVFATTDQIKFSQNQVAQARWRGELRAAHTVVEPYQIPEEQQFTYAGNAFVKMVNIMEVALERDLRNPHGSEVNLLAHDGGLAAFLMNDKGERYTGIFTDKRFFPTSAHVMNPVLSGPGVELAELYKSSPNFDSVVDSIFRKVGNTTDLKIYDSVVQMCIPLTEFRNLYDSYQSQRPDLSRRSICEHIARVHAISVSDVQETKLFKHPQYDSKPLSTDTTHFLEAVGFEGRSRAQVPEWVEDSPTVSTYNMMMEEIGAVPSDPNQIFDKNHVRSPKIAVPGMLMGNRGNTRSTGALKDSLKDNGINWRLGAEYWKKFNIISGVHSPSHDFFDAAIFHRKHVRELLAEHDFLYIPKDYKPATPREWEESLLLVSSAMVQRQVFKKDAPFIIMEKGPFADEIIEVFKSLKNMGLVGQQFEHLVKLTDDHKQSANAIESIMHMIPAAIRPHPPIAEVKNISMPENLTAVVYCSAGNKNAQWIPDAERMGEYLAKNNIDLKLGGGKDGMMKSVADGYLRGLSVRVAQGDTPSCKLHLIQCKDTQTLEGDYDIPSRYSALESLIIRKCYGTIEERRYDLQKSHVPVVLAGGIGTFEEMMCELVAVHKGEKDKQNFTLHVLSQTGMKPDKNQGRVYEFLDPLLKRMGLGHGLVKVSLTIGEIEQSIAIKKQAHDAQLPSVSVRYLPAQPFPSLNVA